MKQNFNKDVKDFFSSKKSYKTPDGILFYTLRDYTNYMKAYKNISYVDTIQNNLKDAFNELRSQQSFDNELQKEEP
jgi:hypothetical protein